MSRHTRLVRPNEDAEADRFEPNVPVPSPRRAVVDVTGLTDLQVRDVELFIAMLRDGPLPASIVPGHLFARAAGSGSRFDEEVIELRAGGPDGVPFARLEPIALGGRTLRNVLRAVVAAINGSPP